MVFFDSRFITIIDIERGPIVYVKKKNNNGKLIFPGLQVI